VRRGCGADALVVGRLLQACAAHGFQKNLALFRPEKQMFDGPGDQDVGLCAAQLAAD